MQRSILHNIRPLTKKMKKLLFDCHEREIQKQTPYGIYYTQSAKGLVTRGLFYAKEYKSGDKFYLGFYLTPLGIDYLQSLQTSENLPA